MKKLFKRIEKYSKRYDLSFQFWGHGQNNYFIEKYDVELYSSGGFTDIKECLIDCIAYLDRINRVNNDTF